MTEEVRLKPYFLSVTHPSILKHKTVELIAELTEPAALADIGDDLHTFWQTDRPMDKEFVKKLRYCRAVTDFHIPLAFDKWVLPAGGNTSDDEVKLAIKTNVDNALNNFCVPVTSILFTIKNLKGNFFEGFQDTQNTVIVKCTTNEKDLRNYAIMLEEAYVKLLRNQSGEQNLQWNVNGISDNSTGVIEIDMHLTKNSIFIGIVVMAWKLFNPHFLATSFVNVCHRPVVHLAELKNDMCVLDLNAFAGETLMEIMTTHQVICIGLSQNGFDAKNAVENARNMRKFKKVKYFDIIHSEMLDFVNFFPFERIFAKCLSEDDGEIREYFRRLVKILEKCLVNTRLLLVHPENELYPTAVHDFFDSHENIQIENHVPYEEYNRKYRVLILKAGRKEYSW